MAAPAFPIMNNAAPAEFAAAVTPSDTPLTYAFRALYVGGAGDVSLTMQDGTVVVFTAVPAGSMLPVRAKAVRAATTATNIVALY